MTVRRLAKVQPESFAFTPENHAWADEEIRKYPEGRQWSAVLALLWRAQEQAGGWLPEPALRHVAEILEMPYIRVYEVATFYTMFNLEPAGDHQVYVCTTTPCWLRGSDDLVKVCKRRIHETQGKVSPDGKFSWIEMECMGACVNAPMVQIGKDNYEDLTAGRFEEILEELAAGKTPKPGPQSGRHSSEPAGGPTTLTDTSLYSGEPAGD